MEEDIRGKVIEKTYDGVRYALYVPENVNENTPVFTYVHGSGGTVDWRRATTALNENGANSIIIMPTMSWNSEWDKKTMNIVNSIKDQYGITTKNISGSGFSMGGFAGYTTVAENIRQNPDIEPQIVYFIDDYSNKTYYNHSSTLKDAETVNLFKENETVFFIYEPNSKNPGATRAFGESGLNVIRVICSDGNHVNINNNFFNNGIYDYMAGGTLPKDGYTYQRYNKETKQWETINYEDIATKEALYNYYNIDTFTTRLNSLSSLGDLTIESDDKTLQNYLNEIRGAVRSTNFLQGNFSEQSYGSTTKVPSGIPEIITAYFQATSSLLTKIANETTQFAKIAETYQNLDFNLSQDVEEIPTDTLVENTNQSNNSNTLNQLSGLAGVTGGSLAGTLINDSTTNSNNANQSNQQSNQNTQSSQTTRPQQNQTSSHNNSNQNTNQNNHQSNNSQQENNNSTSEEKSPLEEFPKYEELYSDETKLVYNCDDEYKIIIHKDGDKVVGIEHYYDFETSEKASEAIEKLTQEYSTNENFDKIVQNERYVKVLFKEESYQNITITQIKEEFSDLEEVIKGGSIDV